MLRMRIQHVEVSLCLIKFDPCVDGEGVNKAVY